MSRFARGRWSHSLFISFLCWNSPVYSSNKDGLYFFVCVPFRFFRTQPPRFLPPPLQQRWGRRVFGMLNSLILCRGRTVHFPESTRKINIKREIRSLEKGTHSCTHTHTHKTQMLLHADNTFFRVVNNGGKNYTTAIFLSFNVDVWPHENQRYLMTDNYWKNVQKLEIERLQLVSLGVCGVFGRVLFYSLH